MIPAGIHHLFFGLRKVYVDFSTKIWWCRILFVPLLMVRITGNAEERPANVSQPLRESENVVHPRSRFFV